MPRSASISTAAVFILTTTMYIVAAREQQATTRKKKCRRPKKKFALHENHPQSISSYPQPPNSSLKTKYRYLTFDKIQSVVMSMSSDSFAQKLKPDTLVYTVLGGGSKSSNKGGKLFEKARVVSDDDLIDDDASRQHNDTEGARRVLVKYSSGSTYRVKRSMLLPIIDYQKHIRNKGVYYVIACDETPIYRRISQIHASASDDTFLEIGSDFGRCTEGVRQGKNRADVREGGGVSKSSSVDGNLGFEASEKGTPSALIGGRYDQNVIGVDKSTESNEKANKDFPRCEFFLGDVFQQYGESVLAKCRDRYQRSTGPDVVSIDINGDRGIKDVLKALECVMSVDDLPYLIIVKSRELFQSVRLQWS